MYYTNFVYEQYLPRTVLEFINQSTLSCSKVALYYSLSAVHRYSLILGLYNVGV